MTRLHDSIEGRTKQIVGEIIGDGRLVAEGDEQVRRARLHAEQDDQNNGGSSPGAWPLQNGDNTP